MDWMFIFSPNSKGKPWPPLWWWRMEPLCGITVRYLVSLVAQMIKNLPAMWETQVQSLGWEDPLEKGMATHPSILAWRIPWTEEPGGLRSVGLQRARHDWATNTFIQYLSWKMSFFWNHVWVDEVKRRCTVEVVWRSSHRSTTMYNILPLYRRLIFN